MSELDSSSLSRFSTESHALTVIGCDLRHYGLVHRDAVGMAGQVMAMWCGNHEMT